MIVSLINIDSVIPNLALEKIKKYHLDRGDEVYNDFPSIQADLTYVSCVFTKNKDRVKEYENGANNRLIGGSGYSCDIVLPREIEQIKPRINMGFTTRGCIRKCSFCIVPIKEGNIRIEGDLYDLWDGHSKDIVILDNNILAIPKHFSLICQQARKEKIRLDFNQGLDHRLLTEEIVRELKSIRHIEYRFAFDDIKYLPTVEKAIKLCQNNGINRCSWYVLVGYNSTFEDDLFRVNFLKQHNQNAFIQRYESIYKNKKYIALARWVNQHHIFQKMSWEQFLDRPENKNYKIAVLESN